MKLPFSFAKKTAPSEIFLGLFLKEYEVVGFILENRDGTMRIRSQETVALPTGWEGLAEAVDDLIFSLEKKNTVHIEKTIFFIYSHYIDQRTKQIQKEYLHTFKELVKSLQLKPMGYIECHEALSKYLEKKDHAPLTALLVEVDKKHVSVILYKAGHFTHLQSADRTDDTVLDLERLFAQIGESVMLPSRLILYDSFDLHKESTAILSHRWNSDMFVQPPKVEVLQPDRVHEALVAAFEAQSASQISEAGTESQISDDTRSEIQDQASPDEVMGFAIGQDAKPPEESLPPPPVSSQKKLPSFAIGAIVARMHERVAPVLQKLRTSGNKKRHLPLVGVMVVLFLALFLSEYFFHQVSVDVLFPSKTFAKDVDITASMEGEGDVQVKLATLSAELSDHKATTGTRDQGEKAHGTITVYNFDDTDHTIAHGTVLDSGGIKFTFDNDVKVASASMTTVSGSPAKLPGKTQTSITAVVIGPEGNLSTGKTFTITGFSSSACYGTNDGAALSGGSKKQIKTVAKQDIDGLKTSLLSQAKQQATESLKNQSQTEGFLPSLTETSIASAKASKEVGEEANEVTVKAMIITNYYSYESAQMRSYLARQFQDDLNSNPGFQLAEDRVTLEVADATKKKNTIDIKGTAKGLALKEVSKTDIIKSLVGKKQSEVSALLQQEFQATSVDIKSKYPVPILSSWMPFFAKNIHLTISSL